MEIYKKKIIILNKVSSIGQGYKGSVQLLRLNETLKMTVDVLTKDTNAPKRLYWLLSTVDNYIIEELSDAFRFTKILPNNFDFENGASFMVFDYDNNEVISYGEYGNPLVNLSSAKGYFNKNKENVIINYDDELLATEDYFKLEDELLRNEIKSVRDKSKEEKSKGEKEKEFSYNEEGASSFKSDRYYEKIKLKLNELFSTHKECNDLKLTINNGKFIKIKYDDERYYLVGVLYELNTPTFLAYGVKGRYGETPYNFEGGKFVPISPFNLLGEGYYLIFQDLTTGEKV